VDFAVVAEGLTMRFGHVTAVDNLNLTVPAGTVFGFLVAAGVALVLVIDAALFALAAARFQRPQLVRP
jgi:ABC-type uncharacterized transport system ATPase subunit